MLKKILLGFAALIVILLIVIATRPATFRVERSTVIASSPDIAFNLINDFHAWAGWSPWNGIDPNQTIAHEGAPHGVGAVYKWSGNDDVGEGLMTIEESQPYERVKIKLDFLRPFASTSSTEFTVLLEGGASKVTWAMEGQNDFIGKAFSLFVNMDKMLGKDFDKGLALMKTKAEELMAKKLAEEAAATKAAEDIAAAAAVAVPAADAPALAAEQ